MSHLSPELERLVQAGRQANLPQPADFDRVLAAVEHRIAASVTSSLQSSSAAKSVLLKLSGKAVMAVAGVALLGGGLLLMTTQKPMPPVASAPALTVIAPLGNDSAAPVAANAAGPREEPSSAPALLPSAKGVSAVTRSRDPGRERDNLSEEVAILYRAEAELHAGRAESALRLLNDHARKFPKGVLAEERTAARIQALCALGRSSEANALIARLNPRSLHGEHAKDACAPSSARQRR